MPDQNENSTSDAMMCEGPLESWPEAVKQNGSSTGDHTVCFCDVPLGRPTTGTNTVSGNHVLREDIAAGVKQNGDSAGNAGVHGDPLQDMPEVVKQN